ncbi:MAG: glycosyltransferase, partial [Proteobacteria bacterium]|nr:glycosyltransferase [Pseudomonadota bacterium]
GDADLILPNSEHLAARLRAVGAPAERMVVHRLGVDVTRFAPPPSTPRAGDAWTAVAIGRCVPKKGFATLIRAMALAGEHAPALTVIGDGPLLGELRALAVALGVGHRVRFAGWLGRAEVAAELARADALIAPSETAADGDIEGMPVVIMEAMATGLAILGTRHSGIPEIVRDGINGLTVAERDADGLAQAMSRLADPATRARFGRASREIAVQELSHATLMRRLVALLLDNGRIDR